jgi:hypothetical protein
MKTEALRAEGTPITSDSLPSGPPSTCAILAEIIQKVGEGGLSPVHMAMGGAAAQCPFLCPGRLPPPLRKSSYLFSVWVKPCEET